MTSDDDRHQGAAILDYMAEMLTRDGELASVKVHSGHMADLVDYIQTTDDHYSDERHIGRLLLLQMNEMVAEHGDETPPINLHSVQMRALLKLAPITETAKPAPGKHFFGMHDGRMRTGVIVAAIGTTHYTVKFDDVAILPVGEMSAWTFADAAYERNLLEFPSRGEPK
ncbi:hypothetical protein [Bradyrhizobium sp.]|uniref:hypothetical protein n=1 Tax=Bradyrhizobium sp. TaxID=376 RepID=UPI0039E60392